ncbi:MAG: Rpn family recombination-promoting nuclease/putative transposase [Eubacterium sp.]|nr:Rpn family recombination-promoting nuclease/putative transposase [Eubacterium sp.]
MPIRIIGYDGASYRSQLQKMNKRADREIVPVVTIVLYFGTEKRWTAPKNLKALMNIPKGLRSMCEVYDRAEQKGLADGFAKGIKQGLEKGLEQGLEQTIAIVNALKGYATSEELLLKNGSIEIVK